MEKKKRTKLKDRTLPDYTRGEEIFNMVSHIVGGVLALGKVGGFTLGGLASFLTFNKSFSMPINQISMQMIR